MSAAPGSMASSDRLDRAFARIRAEGRTGLITYVTAGDPDLDRSAEVLRALDRAGADVIEVGAPFSEPLADGVVIQRAIDRALRAGVTLDRTLDLIARVRTDISAPVVLFTYANPLLRMGAERFAARASSVGVDAVLVLDLPMEEAGDVHRALESAGLAMIFLLSPTTTTERMRSAAKLGRGFLYGISRLGVTGARDTVATGAKALAERMRSQSTLPIAIGFGVSRPEHVAEICQWADAAVVGSALVEVVERNGASPTLVQDVEAFVRWLKGPAARA